MYCRRCGKKIPDESVFCVQCGEVVDVGDYPEIKKNLNDNEIFASVYYGPDYYKDRDEDGCLKDDEKERGLKKVTGWLTRKRNKL